MGNPYGCQFLLVFMGVINLEVDYAWHFLKQE
jgi:hypothetical protein